MEMFRFSTYFCICLYYTQKASGLLDNRRTILKSLRYFFFLSISLLSILCLYLFIAISEYVDPSGSGFSNLPSSLVDMMQVFTWAPIVMSLIFFVLLRTIAHRIEKRVKFSTLDKKIYELQKAKVKTLRNVVIAVFLLSLFVFAFQMVEVFLPSKTNTMQFGPDHPILNSLDMFLDRSVIAIMPYIVVLYLFFVKSWSLSKNADLSYQIVDKNLVNIDDITYTEVRQEEQESYRGYLLNSESRDHSITSLSQTSINDSDHNEVDDNHLHHGLQPK
jgi:hypothetical protein